MKSNQGDILASLKTMDCKAPRIEAHIFPRVGLGIGISRESFFVDISIWFACWVVFIGLGPRIKGK